MAGFPVEDVLDCQPGIHERAVVGWRVYSTEGDWDDDFENEPDAVARAEELNSAQART